MNYEDAVSNLPISFRNEIGSHNIEEKRILIRSSVKSIEECELWMKEFSESSGTKWIVRDIERDSYNFTSCIIHVCYRSSFNKTHTAKSDDDSKNCPCAIHFIIKKLTKRTKKMDRYVREGLAAIITINYNHNHPPLTSESTDLLLETTYTEEECISCEEEISLRVEVSDVENSSNADISDNQICTLINEETLIMRLKSELPNLTKKGNSIVISEKPFAVAIVTPIMLRAQQLPFAKDIVFVDTATINEIHRFTISFMLTQSPIGAIPLTIIILKQNTAKHIEEGFKLAKRSFGLHSFYGQHYPSTVMSDDSEAERAVIRKLWPESQLLLCRFNLPRCVRQWLAKKENNIEKKDRSVLLKMFLDMLMSMNVRDAESYYLVAIGSILNLDENIPLKYPKWIEYVNSYWQRREEWCLAFRNECVRGNHTNNFSKTFIRLYKDKVLGKCKVSDIVSLVRCTCTEIERYYVTRLLHFSIGRVDIPRLFLKKQVKNSDYISRDSIESMGGRLYLVPSKHDSNEMYTVDASVGYCSCSTGKFGSFCEHQAAIYIHFCEIPPNMPPVTTEARYSVAVLAKGKQAPDVSFFTPLHPNLEDGQIRKSDESTAEIINEQNVKTDAQQKKNCIVPNCEIRNYKFSRVQRKLVKNNFALSIHKMPKNIEKWKSWMKEAGIQDWNPSESNYICSLHFHDYCFNLKNELHEDAIPNIHFDDFESHIKKIVSDSNPDCKLSDEDDADDLNCTNEVSNAFSFDTSVIKEDDNEEVIECTLLPKNKEDYKLLDYAELAMSETRVTNKVPLTQPTNTPTTPHQKQPPPPPPTTDTAKKLYSMIKSGTFDKIPTIDPSLENVVYQLLNTLKTANANNDQSNSSPPIPNIYIIVNKLNATDVDSKRKVVFMDASEIVSMVNDLLTSIKTRGANIFINSKDVTIICGNPAMFLIKYISVKNCDETMNSVYVITTENLTPYVKIVKKNKVQPIARAPMPVLLQPSAQNTPVITPTRTYRQIKPKGKELDESQFFRKGEKWFVCSPFKNISSSVVPCAPTTQLLSNTFLLPVVPTKLTTVANATTATNSPPKIIKKNVIPIPKVTTQIENIIMDVDPVVEEVTDVSEALTAKKERKRKTSGEVELSKSDNVAVRSYSSIRKKSMKILTRNAQQRKKAIETSKQKMQKLRSASDACENSKDLESAKNLEQDAIQFFVGKMKGATPRILGESKRGKLV